MTYPRTSPAAVLPAFGGPTEIRELPVPPLEDDALLVEVEAATLCGTDVHIADGDLAGPGFAQVPLVPGHEIVGRVVARGRDRRTDSLGRPLREGDRIAWAYAWCDRCYWCTVAKQPTLCANRMMYGWGSSDTAPYLTGGFSRYCYVRPRCRTVLVPESLPAPLAASATCALRTAIHAFEALGPLHSSDTVVIQGVGPVGLYAQACAVAAGAGQVLAFGAPAGRLDVASRWGATRAVDLSATSAEERLETVRAHTDGRGADVVVECAGVADAFTEAVDLVRRGGRIVVVGAADPRPSLVPATTFNLRQVSVVGTVSADISHYHRAFAFLERHRDRFDFPAVLGDPFPLDRVDAALDSVRTGGMKPVVLPSAA